MAPCTWEALVLDPGFEASVKRITRRAGLTLDSFDDVLQEVRLRALRGDLGPPSANRSAALERLRGTARNIARELARARTRGAPSLARAESREAGPAAGPLNTADLGTLTELLARRGAALSSAQRAALDIAVEGLGPRVAARRLRISPSAYVERLGRAVRHLRGESRGSRKPAPLPAALVGDESLPAVWRAAILLRVLGRSYAEIGLHIGRSEEAARCLLRRLRRRLGPA